MEHEEKIEFMRIALGMAGYSLKEEGVDMIISLYELVQEHKGKTDLLMVSKVEEEVKKRANTRSRSELLDKVSKKV